MLALIAGMVRCAPATLYDLTISSSEGGSVTTPDEATSTYREGRVVDLVAEADEGYRFVEWTGAVDTVADVNDAITTITMNDDYSITANLEEIPEYDLTISSTAGGSVTTPGEGTFAYYEGADVELVAQADEGYQFVNWTGDMDDIANVNDATTTITINDDYSITANFGIGMWDWHDLHAIRDNLGSSYVLMNNLDSTTAGYEELASPTANGRKGWQPIGTSDDRFSGIFDGHGYEIRDLFIDRPGESLVALFGAIDEGGIIKNVGVVNADVTGDKYVGGLVGENAGTVTDSYSTGSVTGKEQVGGLLGRNHEGTVRDSYSTGSVNGDRWVGGLVGTNYESTVSDSYSTGSVSGKETIGGLMGVTEGGTVSSSYATGKVTGEDIVGGLVGMNGWGSDVSNSSAAGDVIGDVWVGGLVGENEGIVTDSYSTGSVTGKEQVGGLFGRNHEGIVRDSYSTGSVNGELHVGGLVGANYWGTVSESYANGSVIGGDQAGGLVGTNEGGGVINSYSSASVNGDSWIGGLVGVNGWGSDVSNSYSTGTVTGHSSVGGLVGENQDDSTVSNSFWDTETSGQATSAEGIGKTTAEMKSIATFSAVDWNIIAVASPSTRNPAYVWNIVGGQTYPFLRWESQKGG